MKKFFVLIAVVCSGFSSIAQFDFDTDKFIDNLIGTVESDRPGQAYNAKTAGMVAIQLQTGFNYERYNQDKVSLYEHFYVPTNLRFGLTRKWELNTSFYYLKSMEMDTLNDTTLSGFQSPELGIRYAFMSGDGWRPYLALQANLSFLSHKGTYRQQQTGGSLYLVSSNRFEVLSVNTNFGVVMVGDGLQQPVFPWVLNIGWMIGNKFGMFVEGFGEFKNLEVNWDAGCSYVPIPDLQLDLFGGMKNLTNDFPRWFIEGGVTYRFSFLKILAKKKADQFMKGGFGGS